MDRLLTIKPLDLVLKLELGKKSHATIHLQNVMHTMPVAYYVQPSSAPKRYSIKPAHGIIEPLDTALVTITLNPQAKIPATVPYSVDKLLVKSVVVPGGSACDPVPLDWFTARKKHVFSDHGIRVLFTGGCILRKLVDAGSMEDVREVLELDDEIVDSKDKHGATALHAAVAKGRPDLVQLLLEFNADVNMKNKRGQTALHDAALRGETLIAELLLAKGADVNARTSAEQFTALSMAVSAGHAEVAKLLVENGADVNESTAADGMTLLHMALNGGSYECLEMLLQKGADANAQTKGKYADAPLHWAVERGDSKAVEILLKHGARKELKNRSGKTPADLARDKGRQGGAFLVALVFEGAVRRGVRKGSVVDVQESLKKGAMPAGADEHGWTALHMAAFKGHMGVVRTLIEAGADLKCKDNIGYTPLHCAAEAGKKDIVKLLLKHGAPVNACTCSGITALDLATTFKYTGIVSLLLEWGGCSRKPSKGAKT